MSEDKILWEAEFNPKVKTYWLLSGTLVCLLTVVLIPLIPIWYFVGLQMTEKYLRSLRCTLTTRNLKVAKGVFVKQEKTVPLDRITDVGLVQGPIMRSMNLEALSVETAGQSSQGALVQMTGIRDGRAFRDAVLAQRDKVAARDAEDDKTPPGVAANDDSVLIEIRDILRRMEAAGRTVSPSETETGI